jgi:uncharacterized BrkB/YihY/UPF0761 family membrane protein
MDLANRPGNNGQKQFWRKLSVLILLFFLPLCATACPVCGSETGVQVRAAIFGNNFLRDAARTLAPAPLLVGAVAAIYFGAPRNRSKKKDLL